ncbi:TIGR03936 family radical SAM-associated protein [Fusobacterium mortiferum]|uniref:Radical SAM protein n=1 Tax=Fusobacterium mortiferum ATCC 9817 TaxID=469616 RepID=A0ABM6TWP7_FUSMR|nr:TIGR03936 family radical SAM-associated protein [Fusobacterium mortiferum]AVQ19062.1 radical SAM protein [Fusobacterium mortiferum ATCC 9817]EEO35314.1 radical SAM-linked protein [Fusobacterium mortiferum ATCC 9817]
MKKRVYFDKYGEMKFISHLDLLRFFERLFNKAEIPVKYSEGFHPRPKMSFGSPISLGTEAYNEIMDFETDVEISNEEVVKRLNESAVLGFKVNKVEEVPRKSSIMEEFTNMLYTVEGSQEDMDKFEELFNRNEILEVREKKGKIVTRNLKERLKTFSREGNKISMEIINTSPNSYLEMLGIEQQDVQIKRLGYKINN